MRAALLGAFGTLGLPWLREHLTDEAMRDTWLASIGDDVTLRGRVDWDNGCLLVVLLRQEDRHGEAARLWAGSAVTRRRCPTVSARRRWSGSPPLNATRAR